jgi:hypothetical protein
VSDRALLLWQLLLHERIWQALAALDPKDIHMHDPFLRITTFLALDPH